ncbi:MAG TPA: hypothetical protein VK279_05880 [Solirubrobacteraceae bacterium]|nr:hypothetical protein [Solirubrobacteraceae bacterium]
MPAPRKKRPRPAEAADAVRAAVDQTFAATVGQAQTARGRASELVDELSTAAGRVRDALDDLRVASVDDVKALRADLRALEARVAELERATSPRKKKKSASKKGA